MPKNYNLQPEPALGQVLGLPNVRGYNFDVQIVTAPVTDGSLSSCPPAEAVTWGKVDKDTYQSGTESMQADYSTVMPFLVKALLDNRKRYEQSGGRAGEEELFRQEPKAQGYLRPRQGYRLYENREELVRRLTADVKTNREWLLQSLEYALARQLNGQSRRPPGSGAQVPRHDHGKDDIDPGQQPAASHFPAIQPQRHRDHLHRDQARSKDWPSCASSCVPRGCPPGRHAA